MGSDDEGRGPATASQMLSTVLTELRGLHETVGQLSTAIAVQGTTILDIERVLHDVGQNVKKIADIERRLDRVEDRQFTDQQRSMILRGIDLMERSPSTDPLRPEEYQELLTILRTGMSSGAAKKVAENEQSLSVIRHQVEELAIMAKERGREDDEADDFKRAVKLSVISAGFGAVLLVVAEAAAKIFHLL